MKKLWKSFAVVFLAGCATFGQLELCAPAYAGDNYLCTVERAITDTRDAAEFKAFHESYVGKKFSVDHETGLMTGALRNYVNPEVIDRGSSGQYFKAVTIWRRGGGVAAVQVLTVGELDNSKKKYFIFLDNIVAYTGTCEHF
jgi:hypothetical protein